MPKRVHAGGGCPRRMNQHQKHLPNWNSFLLAVLTLTSLAGGAFAAEPKLVLHASRASLSEPCQSGIARCQEALVSGSLYSPSGAGTYFVYLMASQFDPAEGIRSIQAGIDYDAVTLSGVDIFSWNLCADSQEPGPGWYQVPKSVNRLIWNVEQCPSDTLVVGGYFYMTCYTPSFLTISPFGSDSAAIQTCIGNTVTLPPTALGYVAFGSIPGCNPCLAPCNTVSIRPTSWSALKSLVGQGP